MEDLGFGGEPAVEGPSPRSAAPPRPTGTKRWARVTYGSEGRGPAPFSSGLAGSFVATAQSSSVHQAVFGAFCWMLSTSPARRIRGPARGFRFGGREIEYLPRTLATERRAEIPLGLDFLRSGKMSARRLEVGNVLAPHDPPPRDVVDLYEHGPGILNEDIVRYRTDRPYDRIVSLSTLEHVGFDEPRPEPRKFRAALDHLLDDLLAPEGRFLATVPLGYNPEVDRFVREPSRRGIAISCLRRTSMFNEWTEFAPAEIRPRDLVNMYPGAGAIGVLTADRGPSPIGAPA